MAIEPIESLLNKIMRRYDGRPTGWNVLTDYKGNVLVLGPKEGYMLKMVSINPEKQIGVGMKFDSSYEMRSLVEGGPSWGFRPLSAIQTEELLNGFRHAEKRKRLISEILERKPVSTLELERKRPKMFLSGPFIRYPNLNFVSKSQKELELKLKIEAEKLFRKKYPYRATIYH